MTSTHCVACNNKKKWFIKEREAKGWNSVAKKVFISYKLICLLILENQSVLYEKGQKNMFTNVTRRKSKARIMNSYRHVKIAIISFIYLMLIMFLQPEQVQNMPKLEITHLPLIKQITGTLYFQGSTHD